MKQTSALANDIGARIKICLAQARLTAEDIGAVFLTGGSAKLVTCVIASSRVCRLRA